MIKRPAVSTVEAQRKALSFAEQKLLHRPEFTYQERRRSLLREAGEGGRSALAERTGGALSGKAPTRLAASPKLDASHRASKIQTDARSASFATLPHFVGEGQAPGAAPTSEYALENIAPSSCAASCVELRLVLHPGDLDHAALAGERREWPCQGKVRPAGKANGGRRLELMGSKPSGPWTRRRPAPSCGYRRHIEQGHDLGGAVRMRGAASFAWLILRMVVRRWIVDALRHHLGELGARAPR